MTHGHDDPTVAEGIPPSAAVGHPTPLTDKDIAVTAVGLARANRNLVIDDGTPLAFEVRQAVPHGLKLFG